MLSFKEERDKLILYGKKLSDKRLISFRSGNLSCRVDKDKILISAHNSLLGDLDYTDILLVNLKGEILEGDKEITSEKSLHLDIYNKFPNIKVIMHAHPPYTVAYFYYFKELERVSFESSLYLGKVPVIFQDTPTVTDTGPVLEALKYTSIVVLSGHGVVSVGEDFVLPFGLIELLEEQAKISLELKKIIKESEPQSKKEESLKKYKLLSDEHTKKLVDLVNQDEEAQRLGRDYGLTCTIAVKDIDTQRVVRFVYERGKIVSTDNLEDADFLIIGNSDILKRVFNREIDPFTASMQGKVKTKGDFTKLSKWYPVLKRTFKLWEEAQVE